MSIHIQIIDKTSTNNGNTENIDNPLELLSKKIELGQLEVARYESTFNVITGICETDIVLKDTVGGINYQYYKNKQQEILLRTNLKDKKEKQKDWVDCHFCENHDYDTLFGGDDEYELCEKGHELFPDECDDFEEL